MRRLALFFCVAVFSVAAWEGQCAAIAQAPEEGSASWSKRVEVVGEREAASQDRLYEVVFEAKITPGWHLYDLGPYAVPGLATSFDFSTSEGIELVGELRALDEPQRHLDPVFGFEVGYWEGTARFAQQFRGAGTLAGEVEYQICKDEVGCIRGVWDFGRNADGESNYAEQSSEPDSGSGLIRLILAAILWGFAALLTPCVFPMVPMTVSFFMGGGGDIAKARLRALLFGGFIIALYTLPIAIIILTTYLAGGETVTADIFNWLATHWIPNVLFFVVFMVFAASLLGAFELRMPSRLVNRSDRGAEKGGLMGVFFLALTLVLVSFSCTGPIVGTVLIKSTQGEFWVPIITMLVFSAAFALPFTLLAFFPGLLEKLPRSGGWLSSVKVILGLVEIALGLKFLSVADQTYHWGILPREVYLAIWIVVFSILGFYLLGKLRFKHDSEVMHIGVGRLFAAIVVFSFTVWLVPGMWGAPLSAISGYLPPLSSQEFRGENGEFGSRGGGDLVPRDGRGNSLLRETVKYANILHLPHGLTGYFDFEQGLAAARREGKPVFVDFTGHGCVNCREMEARVWVDPEVLRLLRERYIVVALYSDDRTQLPENEWVTTSTGKTLKTLGRVNSYLINTRYGVSSQPAYLLLDEKGELLAPVYGYSLDIEKFIAFLKDGK